jgi:sugar O-acyltransferase (sialic acid O-acetyltransferase NeuD family)
MHIHLLGYSESAISRILDCLLVLHYSEEVVVVQNIEVQGSIPYIPPGICCKKISWDQWKFDANKHQCLPGVAKPGVKKMVYNFFQDHCSVHKEHYISLVHPSSVIASTVQMGSACFIEPGTIIASFASLGFGVLINRGSTIGHHTVLGNFVCINPGVHVAGHCYIGEGTEIGIGAVLFDHIAIGSNSIIGAGSVVTKDVPDNVVAWGNPCKVIKNNLTT